MALKLGSLFVSLDANTTGFSKSMSTAMKTVEKFSREVKKAANDAAQVNGAIVAAGVAVLKLASDVSGPAKSAMDELSLSMKQAAKPVAEALVPAVREASALLRGMGQAFSELSPETKAMVGDFFKSAAATVAVSLVVGRLATQVGSLAGVFKGVAGAIAAVGVGPLLAILAVIAAVAAGIAVLHIAWRENWGGMQQVVQKVAQWFADTWDTVLSHVTKAFSAVVDGVAVTMKAALEIMAQVAEATGKGPAAAAMRIAKDVVGEIAKDLKSGAAVKRLVVAGLELGKAAGTAFLEEWKLIFKELGYNFEEFLARWEKMKGGAELTVGGPAKGEGGPTFEDLGYGENVTKRGERAKTFAPRRAGSATDLAGPDRRAFADLEAQAAKDAADASAAAGEATKSGLMNVAQDFVGRLGNLGGLINNVVNAASTGGPWVALATALAGLAAETQAFQTLVAQLNGALKMMAAAFEPAVSGLLDAVIVLVAPAFKIIGSVLESLAPVFRGVGGLLRRLAPVIGVLGRVLALITPLFEVVGLALQGLGYVLEVVARIIFGVVQFLMAIIDTIATGVATIWNGFIDAVASIVDAVVAVFTAGIVQNGGDFVRQGKMASKSWSDVGKSWEQVITGYDKFMTDAVRDSEKWRVEGLGGLNKPISDTTAAVKEFGEAFTNIPSGFKVAAARFNADIGGYQPGLSGADGASNVNIDVINIYANDSEDAMNQLERVILRRTHRNTGSPTAQNALAAMLGAR